MPAKKRVPNVGDVAAALSAIADPALAQEWDNVGLLAGDPQARCTGAVLCIDMTEAVVAEAIARRANFVMAYHPPIFRAVKRLTADSGQTEAIVLRALQGGLHVYAMHTALDAAEGGTNDVIAGLCGIRETQAFEDVPAESPGAKLVVFIPAAEVDAVAHAMFAAGAGRIGDYEQCSYRLAGQGTFFGTETTDPTVGQRGRLETVDEVRLETVCPRHRVAAVLEAIRAAHSYEEPAVDVYPLEPSRRRRGIGRIGSLPRPTKLGALARKLKKALGASAVQIIGEAEQPVRKAAICVGSAGRLPERTSRAVDCDVLVTGEVSHHDALHWLRRKTPEGRSFGVVALGHWQSERPVLASVADRLREAVPGLTVSVSDKDRDPFATR